MRPDGIWVLTIDTKTNPIMRVAEMTMIHEMCHQENLISGANEGQDHDMDKAHERCMLSVARQGGFNGLW